MCDNLITHTHTETVGVYVGKIRGGSFVHTIAHMFITPIFIRGLIDLLVVKRSDIISKVIVDADAGTRMCRSY